MIVMAGIQFTIGKNRLEKTFLYGMERDGDTGILCSEKEGVHYMILPLLDSGIQDCPWGRITFQMKLSEDTVCYLYLCAMNEPKGQDIMMDPERGFTEKVEFLSSNRCLKFINKTDVLMYEIEGRFLWIALEIIGEGGKVENIVVQAPGDNFMQTFPEVYREKNSFMHRYLSIFSSLYNDFQYEIEHVENTLDPDKMPAPLLEMYLRWFGMDVSGGHVNEDVMRLLLKEAAWLNANKGTKQCIDRLCELFIGEKPIILERSMVGRYLRKAEADIYNQLYGESPYDVTLLINSKAEPEKRRFLLHMLQQFKPVRCCVAVIFLENTGVLDSYNYLDQNAYVFSNAVADLDDEQLMDGTVIIQ